MLNKKFGYQEQGLASLRFDSNSCFKCRRNFDSMDLQLDHHEARANGGKDENFVVLCGKCNNAKNAMSANEFYSVTELEEIERRLSLQFSKEEILQELAKLAKDEITFSNQTGIKLPASVERLVIQKQMQPYL